MYPRRIGRIVFQDQVLVPGEPIRMVGENTAKKDIIVNHESDHIISITIGNRKFNVPFSFVNVFEYLPEEPKSDDKQISAKPSRKSNKKD